MGEDERTIDSDGALIPALLLESASSHLLSCRPFSFDGPTVAFEGGECELWIPAGRGE